MERSAIAGKSPTHSRLHAPTRLEIVLVGDQGGAVDEAVRGTLEGAGYVLRSIPDEDEAIVHLRAGGGDAVLLAVGDMPDPRAFVREVRSHISKPILIVHTPDGAEDALGLLELGADDMICHDVSENESIALRELRVRLASSLRASARRIPADGPVMVVGDVSIDTGAMAVRRGDEVIGLSRIEYQLFHRLVAAAGDVVPYEELLEGVWSSGQRDRVEYLRTYMARLRRRLGWRSSQVGPSITAVRGRGYRLVYDDA